MNPDLNTRETERLATADPEDNVAIKLADEARRRSGRQTIYLAVATDYDYHEVFGVFSDQGQAKLLASKLRGGQVEIFVLDARKPELLGEYIRFSITMDQNGGIISGPHNDMDILTIQDAEYGLAMQNEFRPHSYHESDGSFHGSVWARNEQEALAIMETERLKRFAAGQLVPEPGGQQSE